MSAAICPTFCLSMPDTVMISCLAPATFTSIPAGINGAIGAGLAAALGRRRPLDITWLPVSLHVAAAVMALDDLPYFFLGYQLVALVFAVVVWPAGRLGQLIGSAFHASGVGPKTPNQALKTAAPTDHKK